MRTTLWVIISITLFISCNRNDPLLTTAKEKRAQEHLTLPLKLTHKASGITIDVSKSSTPNAIKITYTPIPKRNEPIHFYDMDLPLNGLNGVGRPTLVELVKNPYLKLKQKITISKKLTHSKSPLKHYPAGPIHLTLSLAHKKKRQKLSAIPVTLLLTYMACGQTFCNPPVTQRPLHILIPAEWIKN